MYMNMQDWSILRDLQWFGCYQISNYSVYEKKRLAFYIWSRESLDFIDYFMRRFFFLFDREEELRWTLQYK